MAEHIIAQPLVSIVVRTKDRPGLLQRALQSIAAQTYRPLEVVVVNDGGCDLDDESLAALLRDVVLTYVRLEENRGRAAAANAGVVRARGDFVGFLDDDDEFCPDHVTALMSVLAGGEIVGAYGDCELVSRTYDFETMEFTDTAVRLFTSRDFSLPELLLDNYIPLISVLLDRKVFSEIGLFDESLILYEDWDFFIRCGSLHPFSHVAKTTSRYIQWSPEHQIAQSREYWDLQSAEYDKIIRKHHALFTPDTARCYRDLARRLAAATEKEREIDGLRTLLGDREVLVKRLKDEVEGLKIRLSEQECTLRIIQSGRGWRLLSRYYRIRDRVLGSLR